MKHADPCARQIAECNRQLAESLLPQVRERLERSKHAWTEMLEHEERAQAYNDNLQAKIAPGDPKVAPNYRLKRGRYASAR